MTVSGSFRGGLQVNQTLYGTWQDQVYTVDSDGVITLFSTLAGTDWIFLARNNAATPNIAVVSNNNGFIVNTTAGAVQSYPDGDIGSPTCVAGHEGYFMFGYGDGTIQASDLNSTNLNTLNQASTETNPDGVVEIMSYQGNLYVFGTKTIEIWGNPVNSSGFPLSRVGYNITPGIHSAHCVAGWEPEFGNPPIYVASDNTIRQLNGYQADKISPPDLDRLIANVAEVDANQIEALCYVSGGHAFWQINGPTFSWVYNVNNQKWHERKSYGSDRSVLTRTVNAFDKWLCGNTDTSDLLWIQHDVDTEADQPIVAEMESLTVTDFPNRVAVHRADFNFTVGVGEATGQDPIEVDPQVMIEWSDDGGQSWKGPWWRDLGEQDLTQTRVTLYNTGQCGPMGRRWRWTVSDPVHVGFLGSNMEPKIRNK